jgi:pyruvyltransferase
MKKCYYWSAFINTLSPTTEVSNTHFYNSISNLGDDLNLELFKKLFGKNNVEFLTKEKKHEANYIAIGSILHIFIDTSDNILNKEKLYTFGTGFIEESQSIQEKYIKQIIPIGLRGKVTKNRLEKNGINCSKTVLGDWGLITDYLFKTPKVEKKYDIGVIAHNINAKDPYLDILKKRDSVKIISIKQAPELFIKELLSCKTILSNAMHGLILSDCYGIPNLNITLSNPLAGGTYKFYDYYSAFDIKPDFYTTDQIDKVEDLKDYIEKNYKVNQKKLKKVKSNLRKTFRKTKIKFFLRDIRYLLLCN